MTQKFIAKSACNLFYTSLLTLTISGCGITFYSTTTADSKVSNQKQLDARISKLEKVKIASGKQLTLLRTTTVIFHSNENPAIRFYYITDLPICDTKALNDEARQVWSVLRPRADLSGNSSALVTAQQRVASDLDRDLHDNYTFAWRKNSEGVWRSVN